MKLPANPLRRPFPDRALDRDYVMGLARIALFVFGFLYIFRPFEVRPANNLFWVCLGYGLVTFVTSLLYVLITDRWLGWNRSGPRWTLGKWIADCALILLLISSANFLYHNALIGWTALNLYVLVAVAIPTVMVGLFPIAFSGMAIQLRAERENQRTAAELTLSTKQERVTTSAGAVTIEEGFSLRPEDVFLAESRQNYVRFVYQEGEEATERTVRITLSAAEALLRSSALLRCHRSFLVNVERVTDATGNAQGLRLQLTGWPGEEVPVSRSFVPVLREKLANRP